MVFWPYRTFTRTDIKRFMFSMITFCFQQDFTFDVSPSKINRITGGKIFLRSIIDDLTRSDLRSLRNQQILFLEQLTSLDGKILMDWHLIRNRNFTATPAKFAPAWFKKLETNLLNPSNEHRLIPAEFILRAHNMKGHEILPIDLSTRALNWIGIWNPVINLPILGRIVKKNEDNRTIIVEHWIIDNNTSTINHPNLTRCNGCQNHNTSFSSISRTAHIDTYRYANLFTADDAVIIQSSSPKKINNNLYYFDTPQYDIV